MNHQNISQVLSNAYHQFPHKTAVHLLFSNRPEQTISYQQLVNRSAVFARSLRAAGIQADEVVIIILQHSQELLFTFFGTILRGAIPSIMPFMTEKLLPDHYRAALVALFEITKPAAVVTYKDFLFEVQQASKDTSIKSILVAEDIFLDIGEELIPQPVEVNFSHLGGLDQQPADIALLQHSSGTTGLQKGVALSHQSIFNQLKNYTRALNFSESDIVASWLPLYHDMGLIAGFLMPIILGATLVLLSPFDWVRAPYRLLQAISKHRATFCWLPNFAYNFCALKIRDKDLEGVDLSSLKAITNCSEPMHWKSHRLFFERFAQYGLEPKALATSYAMAENVFAVTQGGIQTPVQIDYIDRKIFVEKQIAHPVKDFQNQQEALQEKEVMDDPDILCMLSAGPPIDGTRVSVLDPEGTHLADRVVGEIVIQSDCMLTGYYHRPDLTKKTFLNGWFLTGDLGYRVKDQIFITGRKKDIIIVGGKNIYPQDLERLAGEVEGVYPGRVVAFGLFNEIGGTEDVVILAETMMDEDQFSSNPEVKKELEIISAMIRQHVTRGSDISLRYVHLVHRNWLIKTSSGKIARSANRDKYLALNQK